MAERQPREPIQYDPYASPQSMVETMARAVARTIAVDRYDDKWRDFIPLVRAVLAAMQEPTQAMFMRGSCSERYNRRENGRIFNSRIGDLPARDAWRLMVGRALEEEAG